MRQVTITCPAECVYLTGAHAPNWEIQSGARRRDVKLLAPMVEGLSEIQGTLLMQGLTGIATIGATRRDLSDRLLAQALTAFRKTLETRERGLLYDHPPDDARAEALRGEIKRIFETGEQSETVAHSDSDLLAVVRALERAVTESLRVGGGATAFVDLAERITSRFGSQTSPRSSLIIAP